MSVDLRVPGTWYARRGWPVFPVAGKVPITPRGFHDATTDEAALEGMLRDPRATGLGIACAAAGLLVVDLDGQEGRDAWADLAARNGGHGRTLLCETPTGGLHIYFSGQGPSTTRRLGQGIDSKGKGGYVVAPPSLHPAGGRYRFCDPTAELANAPGWLLEALRPPVYDVVVGEFGRLPAGEDATPYGRAALEGLSGDVRGAGEGERNATLHRAAIRAGRLEAAGELSAELAERVLVDAAVVSGLPPVEALKTFSSGFGFGRRYPAQKPAAVLRECS